MWIIGMSVIVGVVLISFLATPEWRREDEPTSREIIKRRYARGEIDRATFEQMMRDLGETEQRGATTATGAEHAVRTTHVS